MTDSLPSALVDLLRAARTAADEEARSGPTWLFEQSCDAIAKIEEVLRLAESGSKLLPAGVSLYEHLGTAWVDLEGEVYELVQRIDQCYFGAEEKRA